MDTPRTGKHISQQYNDELEEIKTHLLTMGGLVEQQLEKATRALVEGDSALSNEVYKEGRRVNELEKLIDEESAQCLARRQPAAGDLRLIVTVIKAVSDIERVGDQAERLARFAAQLTEHPRPKNNYHEVYRLAQHVQKMFHDALDAFARGDEKLALSVINEDVNVDHEYEGIMRQHITYMMEDPRSINSSLDVLWAIRALERIGDHACNLCEYLVYLVKGQDIRHTSKPE
ncbi:phosphate signaling complex protein PhoU [sulfur-oxidizing endosymbiont of Gigantopelta aegis]|uniref:phosphate signaling complex protein PhoU n=1 Tax=sulfur-oxidizing endosymbiont of Gigantopelta aegis TaxID=2794934 RepID=UPI0018DDB5D3|nr:phosphate signaling complex protein PhoU [sulfur-oxidizing endosymbiont of Gigantopelta aegis]